MFRNQDRSTFREFAPDCQHFKGSAIFLGRFRSRRPYNVLVSTNLSNAKKLTSKSSNDVIERETVNTSEVNQVRNCSSLVEKGTQLNLHSII